MRELMLGQYTVPFLIMLILQVAFKPFSRPDGASRLPDWAKGYIAIAVGVVVGVATMFYYGVERTFMVWMDYVLYGLVQGAASIGIYKIAQFTPGSPISKKERLP